MRNLILVLMLALSISLVALAQRGGAPAADPKARAQEIIKQARLALWDEAKSKALQSLSITAADRTNMSAMFGGRGGDNGGAGGGNTGGGRDSGGRDSGGRDSGGGRGGGGRGGRGASGDITSEVTLDVLLPDKFLQTTVRTQGQGANTSMFAINGTQVWTDAKSSNPMNMGGFGGEGGFGGGDVFVGGGPPPPGGMGGDGASDGARGGGAPRGQGLPGQFQAPDFGRLMLALLLTTPATQPVEFTYVGGAKTADGKTAEVIDAIGPNNFTTRLFFDPQTHQLLLMSYKTRGMNFMRGSQGQGQGQGNRPPNSDQGNRSAGGRSPQGMGNAAETEIRWYLSEYRNESGLNLAHRIVKSLMGETGPQPIEEMDIKKVKINPSLKPDKFEKKEEKK